jgi:cell division control protein 24
VIAIPSNLSTLTELTSKIERKLRLCGVVLPSDRPLRLRYKDEDGDLIQIYGDDDILMALDATRVTEAERGIVHIYVE